MGMERGSANPRTGEGHRLSRALRDRRVLFSPGYCTPPFVLPPEATPRWGVMPGDYFHIHPAPAIMQPGQNDREAWVELARFNPGMPEPP